MVEFNIKKPIKVHFIGIGGISMSGLALILLDRGFKVSGSDMQDSEMLETLRKHKAKIFVGHSKDNIAKDVKMVIYTAAIHDDNEELIKARELGINVITRAKFLGMLMNSYKNSVAVCGTHGKTTTTSMLATSMIKLEKDPTITVGGILDIIGGNLRLGASDIFLSEACEYMNSFLELTPSLGIILNIEEDHLDFFHDIDDIRSSFKNFANNVKNTIIINSKIENYKYITENIEATVYSFGINKGDFQARNIEYTKDGSSFKMYYKKKFLTDVNLSVLGVHNVENALAALVADYLLDYDIKAASLSLNDFSGAKRRFEKKGEKNGIVIYDDYAHHPSEMIATLNIANEIKEGDLWCIFQPHTYTRTKALFDDFVSALSMADHIIMTDIYAAREQNLVNISSRDIYDRLTILKKDVYYFENFQDVERFVLNKCRKNDMLITMGAGNVVDIADDILK